ncbi:tryptophan 7-halogenase (plasmid) [Streptomyces sp. NBC_00335]|uniref:tryptophan halogenase family protein n=1 Tax=unclassified Streptomyces TaxID=2593676 RepID=UPI0022572E11|nr:MULTISPECIES: tryptophan halogenase family protein [unclassified Streptomyces]MCX5410102.1 tryptophan 7-halogenase [Streptomyces sp. NBC_00086]
MPRSAAADTRVRSVVVLGGGAAGWMTAAYLGKALQGTVEITVLESSSAAPLSLGVATVPSLQHSFFDFLGINEEEWMRKCDASFQMAVRFVNWRTEGEGEALARPLPSQGPDHFYHPFGLLPDYDQTPLSHYWFKRTYEGTTTEPFDYACFREPPVMDAKKSPRWLDGRTATRYAWHFDTGLFAGFLRDFAVTKLGVRHVRGELAEVVKNDGGFVTALRTEDGAALDGDLFVDCSGFRGQLINEAMGEPFIGMEGHLLGDSVVTADVPHDDAAHGVEPYSSAIAMKGGWTWKVPMPGRFGTGYVHSSRFTTREEAAGELCALWGLDPETTRIDYARLRVGRSERAWVKNVVGVGPSSCFLEPLEPTGIHFVTTALHQLVRYFPDRTFRSALVDRFNREIRVMFDDTRDFLQAHFHYAPRNDTPFWRAGKELELPEGIQEKVAAYRAGLPIDAPVTDESAYYGLESGNRSTWTNGSYYCVFAGLGLMPDAPMPVLAHKPESVAGAQPLFDTVKRQQQNLLETLPSTYEYLRQLHGESRF